MWLFMILLASSYSSFNLNALFSFLYHKSTLITIIFHLTIHCRVGNKSKEVLFFLSSSVKKKKKKKEEAIEEKDRIKIASYAYGIF